MTELSPAQRAGITKRRNTRAAFLNTADQVLHENGLYSAVTVKDIANLSGKSEPTFFETYGTKNNWAIDVLNTQLDKALKLQILSEQERELTSYAKVLGKLCIFEKVSAKLPGITQGLVEKRMATGASHNHFLPTFHAEITQTLHDGQEQAVFRTDIEAPDMADFAIDELALRCAVQLVNLKKQTVSTPDLIVDSFVPTSSKTPH